MELSQMCDTTLPKAGWAIGTPYLSPTLKGPKQVHSIYLVVVVFF